ncbi:MAG: M28 family peptidase [Pirellulales bacterium]|nr:M28 family peptidase [Pirellulales bacterium]
MGILSGSTGIRGNGRVDRVDRGGAAWPLRICRAAWFLAAGLAWLAAAPSAAIERDASYARALESITVENLRGHVAFLADDRLEGREAGSRGGQAAGDYLAKQLADHGLEPAGDDGFFQPFSPHYRNVLARLPGSDPRLRGEVIIVGAHYDHVGRGSARNSRGRIGQIHNGADDNASGTSAMLELAEAFALLVEPPKRTILFVGWDAEEKRMLGSQHWAAHPTVPLENVVFNFNMDMIGRLRNETVYVFGTRSAPGLRRFTSERNPGFDLAFDWTTQPNADHWPLFDRGIPYLMFHTGKHAEYHTERDDLELIDHEGMRRLARFLFAVVHDMANAPEMPGFRTAARHETNWMRGQWHASSRDSGSRLGIRWRESVGEDEGVRLTGVESGSPAASAQLRPGDRIVRLGEQEIRNGDELRWAVFHASGPTELVIERPSESEPRALTTELPEQPLRVGITWRVDAASPGAVVLTGVVPGSPAALAGLRAGDRIYQVGGRDFADEDEFADRLKELPSPLELLIERQGRVEPILVRFDAAPCRRAA